MEPGKYGIGEKIVRMSFKFDYGVYLITDDDCLQGASLLFSVEEALKGGVTLVQYRAKKSCGGRMYEEARILKELCSDYRVPLIINDRLDVAMAVGAAGVHIGQEDIPCAAARKILGSGYVIGVSAHNAAEAVRAAADGADYLGCGAVFGTHSKYDAVQIGLSGLEAVKKAVKIPVVGIGGINLDNYAAVLEAGADGAAVISGLLASGDIRRTAEAFAGIYSSRTGNK